MHYDFQHVVPSERLIFFFRIMLIYANNWMKSVTRTNITKPAKAISGKTGGFTCRSSPRCYSNDIEPQFRAEYRMSGLFFSSFKSEGRAVIARGFALPLNWY